MKLVHILKVNGFDGIKMNTWFLVIKGTEDFIRKIMGVRNLSYEIVGYTN